MALIQPRQKVEYKQPKRLNAVSLTLFAILGLLGYAGYASWPVFSLRANVESELAEAVHQLYRMNLNGDKVVRADLITLKKSVTDRVRKAGVRDPKLEVIFERNKKRVSMEARYAASFTFPGVGKKVTMAFRPRVETDASRVEW